MSKMRPSAWAMDTADEIVVSEGLAPSAERELLEKIAAALDAERDATLGEADDYGVCGDLSLAAQADKIERGEHRREEEEMK